MATCIIDFAARCIFGVELVDIVSLTTVELVWAAATIEGIVAATSIENVPALTTVEFVFAPATIEDIVIFCTLEFVVFVVPGFDLTYLREDIFSLEVIYYFDETFSFFAFLIEEVFNG